MPVPDKTNPLFWAHPSGDAKVTGTLITKRKERIIKDKTMNWNGSNINKLN